MTAPKFDEVVHPVNHLRLLAMLAPVAELEFSTLRDLLDASDSSTSKYLAKLSAAGYVESTKVVSRGRRRTWVRLTPAGRKALKAHLAEITRLVHVVNA